MIKVNFSSSSEKFFLKLKVSDQRKISKAIEKVISNPLAGEKFKGEYEGLHRIQAWPCRVIYNFDPKGETIDVIIIGHRQGIYK